MRTAGALVAVLLVGLACGGGGIEPPPEPPLVVPIVAENIEWTDEGIPVGEPLHEQVDHPYTWDGKTLTAGPETTTTLE